MAKAVDRLAELCLLLLLFFLLFPMGGQKY
jgi:hypothetical protein